MILAMGISRVALRLARESKSSPLVLICSTVTTAEAFLVALAVALATSDYGLSHRDNVFASGGMLSACVKI